MLQQATDHQFHFAPFHNTKFLNQESLYYNSDKNTVKNHKLHCTLHIEKKLTRGTISNINEIDITINSFKLKNL